MYVGVVTVKYVTTADKISVIVPVYVGVVTIEWMGTIFKECGYSPRVCRGCDDCSKPFESFVDKL